MTAFSPSDIERKEVPEWLEKKRDPNIQVDVEVVPLPDPIVEKDVLDKEQDTSTPRNRLKGMSLDPLPEEEVDAQLTLYRRGKEWTVTPILLKKPLTARDIHRIRSSVIGAFWREWEARRKLLNRLAQAGTEAATKKIEEDKWIKPLSSF